MTNSRQRTIKPGDAVVYENPNGICLWGTALSDVQDRDPYPMIRVQFHRKLDDCTHRVLPARQVSPARVLAQTGACQCRPTKGAP